MTYTISKDFAFSASHVLDHLPDDHPCARLHGHNYVVRVEITADRLDDRGFVLDYARLDPFGRFIADRLDHRHLNDVLTVPPTAEHLAYFLAGIPGWTAPVSGRVAVGVSETPKTWAWWRP